MQLEARWRMCLACRGNTWQLLSKLPYCSSDNASMFILLQCTTKCLVTKPLVSRHFKLAAGSKKNENPAGDTIIASKSQNMHQQWGGEKWTLLIKPLPDSLPLKFGSNDGAATSTSQYCAPYFCE